MLYGCVRAFYTAPRTLSITDDMKRPLLLTLGFWIPTILVLLMFWSRHWSGGVLQTALPLWDRLRAIAPGSWFLLVLAVLLAGIWMAFLWYRGEDRPLRIRPVTVGFLWIFGVLFMGYVSFGDIWHFQDVPLSAAQKADIMLREFGLTDSTALSPFVMLGHLMGKVLLGVGALLLVTLAMYGYGVLFRALLARRPMDSLEQRVLTLGLGCMLMLFLLLLVALLGLFVPWVLWMVLGLGALMALGGDWRSLLQGLWSPVTLQWTRRDLYLQPLFVLALFLMTAASFLHILRPIPIGWDDIGVYMNVPSLLAEHGSLLGGFGSYNWGLLMALGFSLWQTPYVAMLFSFLGGLLAFFVLYVLIRRVLPEKQGSIPLMLTSVFASTPFVLFQLGEDMKIDLGLLFVTGIALLWALELWEHPERRTPLSFALLGALLGIAFGVKMTAILAAIFIVFFLLLRMAGGVGGLFAGTASLFVLLLANVFAMGGLEIPAQVRLLLLVFTGLVSLVFGGIFLRTSKDAGRMVGLLASLVLGFLVAFSPWMVMNIQSWCRETCPPWSMQLVLQSKMQSPTLPPAVQMSTGSGSLARETQNLKTTLEQEGGTVTEELGRYAGFDTGLMHFLSLPLDATLGINVGGDYVTMGWVYLALVFLMIAYGLAVSENRRSWHAVVLYGFMVFWGFGSLVMEIHFATWFTHIFTISVSLALLWNVALLWQGTVPQGTWRSWFFLPKEDTLARAPLAVHLALATLLYGLLWMYAASGVLWYGIFGFLGLLMLGGIVLERLRAWQRDKVTYPAILVVIALFWILPMMGYKMTTSDTSIKTFARSGNSVVSQVEPAQSFDTRHFILFKAGVLNQDLGLKFFNAEYYAASQLLSRETTSKIFRVGTLLPYFVRSNDTRMATDNQLDQFIATYLPEGNPLAYVDRLYQAGFRYIVFDLGTDSIDKTEQKTLTRKVDIFHAMINGKGPEATPQFTARGERLFEEGAHPRLKEALRASGFVIWEIVP